MRPYVLNDVPIVVVKVAVIHPNKALFNQGPHKYTLHCMYHMNTLSTRHHTRHRSCNKRRAGVKSTPPHLPTHRAFLSVRVCW